MNYFVHDKRDLSPAYVKSCEKFLDNLKLKAAARPPKSGPKLQASRRTEYEECQDQNNPGWREIHKYNKKLQASSALKQTQLKGRIKI